MITIISPPSVTSRPVEKVSLMSRLCRRSFLVLTCLFGFTQWSFADELYAAKVFQNEKGEKLHYRLMTPQGYDAKGTAKYPLVLFLHGAGERGDDRGRDGAELGAGRRSCGVGRAAAGTGRASVRDCADRFGLQPVRLGQGPGMKPEKDRPHLPARG